jgi:hypothetical protein
MYSIYWVIENYLVYFVIKFDLIDFTTGLFIVYFNIDNLNYK